MAATVMFVEINVYEGMVPLVSAYLQGYACRDRSIRQAYAFHKYTTSRKTSPATMLAAIDSIDVDVYAFSCYVWNMGLVRALLAALQAGKPNATFVLGGPQVMHHAERYLDPADGRTLVCNGEGERTFAGVLLELLNEQPDFARVKGLSFCRDGELFTNEHEHRIRDLDEIPSPFLTGLVEPGYRMSVIETNRGCPFRCGFCFWGAANNDQVFKFDEQRVRDEITWLSRNEVPILHIADANWGMLKRDIDLSQHIADCKAQRFYPLAVIFAASKNSPERVTEITKVFSAEDLVSTQPVSMQSLDQTSLELVDRENIKLSAYAEMQDDLNDRGIGSYIELIWPLPGETLSSFKAGIEQLCERNAASVIVYAHLLLHNTPIFANREKLGLVTRRAYDDAAEAEIITQTTEVDYDDFKAGMWFIYAVTSLHNTHALEALGAYLHHGGIIRYAALFDSFIDFCAGEPDHPFTRFCNKSISEARYYDFTNYPAVYHMVLHGERSAFGDLWYRFCASRPWWQDENVRTLFEIDHLNKPYLYRDTPMSAPPRAFAQVEVVETTPREYIVDLPKKYASLVQKFVRLTRPELAVPRPSRLQVRHPPIPYPYNPNKSEEDNADYCSGMITRVASILPAWSSV